MNNLTKIDHEDDDTSKLVLEIVEKVLDTVELDLTSKFENASKISTGHFSDRSVYLEWSSNDAHKINGSHDSTNYITVEYNFAILHKSCGSSFWSLYSGNSNESDEGSSNTFQRKCCSFCKKQRKPVWFYSSHTLYKNGNVVCPILLNWKCQNCGQKGHSVSHCPHRHNPIDTLKVNVLRFLQYFNIKKLLEEYQRIAV